MENIFELFAYVCIIGLAGAFLIWGLIKLGIPQPFSWIIGGFILFGGAVLFWYLLRGQGFG